MKEEGKKRRERERARERESEREREEGGKEGGTGDVQYLWHIYNKHPATSHPPNINCHVYSNRTQAKKVTISRDFLIKVVTRSI